MLSPNDVYILMERKEELNYFRNALNSSIGGLIYSYYMKHFNNIIHEEEKKIAIPTLDQIQEILKFENTFMRNISIEIIPHIQKKLNEFEKVSVTFKLFSEEYSEALSIILMTNIIPEIQNHIISFIIQKLDLNNPENKLFVFDESIVMTTDIFEQTDSVSYVCEETLLHLRFNSSEIVKSRELLLNNYNFIFDDEIHDCISIANDIGASKLLINTIILDNDKIFDILKYIYNIHVFNNYKNYTMRTAPFNDVRFIKFNS